MSRGKSYARQARMGTFSYPVRGVLAEDEEACLRIGWKPHHVQQGFDWNQSTLTAASALSWGNNLTPATSDPAKIVELMAWDAVEKSQLALGSGPRLPARIVLITECVARNLAGGYTSKEELEKTLALTARRPAYERAYANYWANPGSAFNPTKYTLEQHFRRIVREEEAALTVPPPWFPRIDGLEKLYTVPVIRPGAVAILVTGDPDRNKVQTIPGGDWITIEIKLPPNWDELVEKLGYRPLQDFYLRQ